MSDIRVTREFIKNGGIAEFRYIHGVAFEVLMILSAYEKDGVVTLRNKEIAELSGYTIATINKAIQALRKSGIIDKINTTRNEAGIYRISN